jgi:uncharacterized FlgJ-related protein
MTKYRKAEFVLGQLQQPAEGRQPLRNDLKQLDSQTMEEVTAEKPRRECKVVEVNESQRKSVTRVRPEKVFLVFSRLHHALHLRHQTLFLAWEIYQAYNKTLPNPEELSMPEDYLLTVCMSLAMKYEEIYPPSIRGWDCLVGMREPICTRKYLEC